MKRILTTLCLIIAISFSLVTYAQKANTPEKRAQKIVETMNTLLELSKEQKTELLELYSKPKDERGKIGAQVKEVLTAEQYEKYKANKKGRRSNEEGEEEVLKKRKTSNKEGGRKSEGKKKG